jgi:hypothetical protein
MKQLLTTLFILNIYNLYACKCVTNSLGIEIDQSTEIFQGTVEKVEKLDDGIIYEFLIEKIWKGDNSHKKNIKSGFGGGDCGIMFKIGKTYVVYANNGETNRCRRNAEIFETSDDYKLEYYFSKELRDNTFVSDDSILNNYESKYLNEQFEKKDFDFSAKSIAFISNKSIITKQQWYKTNFNHETPVVQLIKLSDEDKRELNYDAILVTWSKKSLSMCQRKRLIKKLRKKTE